MDIKDIDTLIDYIVGKEIRLLMNLEQKATVTIKDSTYSLLEDTGRFTLYMTCNSRTHCLYSGGTFNQMIDTLKTESFRQSIITNTKIYSRK